MAAPLCTCGHTRAMHGEAGCYAMGDDRTHLCACETYCAPGSLEDILGVWRDQGPFPLRNTDDAKLLVDEIVRLRRWKTEALAVLTGWERVWHAAGQPGRLGEHQSDAVADEIERLRALVLTTAARATADAAEHAEQIEACLRDMVIATGPLDRGDAPSEALFKLLDVRHRACDVLGLDPAGHDWPTES